MAACVARWAAAGRKGRGVSEAEGAVQNMPALLSCNVGLTPEEQGPASATANQGSPQNHPVLTVAWGTNERLP
jgi:hypothetical protein